MKKSNKYDYFEGKQITDPDTGKRVYEINSYRLPSVTTILGATKNQEFLKQWKWRCTFRDAYQVCLLIWPFAHVKLPKIQQIIEHYSLEKLKKDNVVNLEEYKNARQVHI